MAADRIAQAVAGGAHGRRRTGPGETFWQYRHGQPGDAQSSIDWRQSARSQGLFVRETEWAAAQTVALWCDGSPSMIWRSLARLPQKRDRAVLLTLALAASLLRGGERVMLLSGRLPPTGGGGALSRFAQSLAADMTAPDDGLPSALSLPRHGEVVLVSDFLMPLERVEQSVRALAARGAVGHLLQVLDPAEESLPFAGRIRFGGCENEGETLLRRTEDARSQYRDRMAAHRDGLSAIARASGWTCAVHHTDQPAQMALLALHMRLSAPRRAGGGLGGW